MNLETTKRLEQRGKDNRPAATEPRGSTAAIKAAAAKAFLAAKGCLLMVLFFTSFSPSQEQLHRPTGNAASILFDKSLDTYHWTGRAVFNDDFGPFQVRFREQYLSTLIRTDRLLVRDEQLLDFTLRHRWTETLSGAFSVSSFILSDDQRVGIGNASSHGIYGGVLYRPHPALRLEPLAGIRFDNQLDQRDRGPSFRLSADAAGFDFDGYRTEFRGNARYDKLGERSVELHGDSLRIAKLFPGGTQNVFQLHYNRNRRDFFTAADTSLQRQFFITQNIETRSENSIFIGDSLAYPVSRPVEIVLHGNITSRGIGRSLRYRDRNDPGRTPLNTEIDELKIDGAARLNYRPAAALLAAGWLAYQERDERHGITDAGDPLFRQSVIDSSMRAQERKNNHAIRTSLGLTLQAALSSADTLSLAGSSSILRYDTPSLNNDDDRDELLHVISLSHMHRFSPYLAAALTAEANLTHLVYLGGTRSADNTWNRIIRLAPRVAYTPSAGFTSFNTFEVLANYTVYDFEFVSPSIRSFAFRQFAFIDSTSIALSRRLTFEWFTHLRLYERGELRWKEFSERPIAYFDDKTLLGILHYKMHGSLLFSLGIRYFSQARFAYAGEEKVPETRLRSVGPVTGIEWTPAGARARIALSGWYEHQRQTLQPDRGIAHVNMECTFQL